jgi:integrase
LPGRRSKYLSPATIRRVNVVIRSSLGQAVKWGWLPSNPAAAASPPKVVAPTILAPPADGVARLLADVETGEPEFYAYLRVAVSTGARRSQMCALQWRDVDLASGAVTFARGVVDGPDGIVVKGTKTNRVYRVTLDAETLEALVEYRGRMEERAALFDVALGAQAFAFSYEPDGSAPWRPDGVTHRWDRYRKRAGLAEVRLHDLRHFMATTMLGAGVPVSIVAGRLGHARAATTLNVYSHFVESGDKVAAETLAAIMADASKKGRVERIEPGPDTGRGKSGRH